MQITVPGLIAIATYLISVRLLWHGSDAYSGSDRLIKICSLINSDPNLFIDKSHKEDVVGKLYFDYRDSIKSIRKFKSYKVASIANSKRFPDLSGFFLIYG